MDLERLWQTALGELEVSLSKANYTTWFKGSFLISIEDGKATLGIPNNYSKDWLRKKFHPQIVAALHKLTAGQVNEVEYVVATKSGLSAKPASSPLIHSPVEKPTTPVRRNSYTQQPPKLNARYTFEHFVVGESNRMAHAAALAVADAPGHAYNPFFVYGDVGLGKTHLIQAIAHAVLLKDPAKRIVYITCEEFTNQFIESLRSGKATEFKHLYRETDLLLIDDIQFIAGKEATQDEFFHTFNSLHQQNKQIIITSDRVPKAIPTLEARLSSRFEWGLIVDMNLPDVETRSAIIKARCDEKNFQLEDKIIAFIAQSIQSNIREIEGALNLLIAHCELTKIEPTEGVVTAVLAQFITSTPHKAVSIGKIIKMVAGFYNVGVDELLGIRRTKELVYPRQIVMHLLRTELNLSFPTIGREVGGKDHTTVMYACDKIEKEMKKNEVLQKELTTLKERLYSIPSPS